MTNESCPFCGEQGANIRNTHKGLEWFYDCGTHIEATEPYRTITCMRISEIRELKSEISKLRSERDRWRKIAEQFAHKPRPATDQRKYAKQEYWNKIHEAEINDMKPYIETDEDDELI